MSDKKRFDMRQAIDASNEALRAVVSNPDHTPEDFCRAAKGAFIERSAKIETKALDTETRTVTLSFSSETPYERGFGIEILGHRDDELRLTRLLDGAPLLVGHDSRSQIGVVESAQVDDDRMARATVRFGQSALATEIMTDVADGIRQKISVGYEVHEMELESEDDGVRTYRATDWEPYEISIVPMPADINVGIGREPETKQTPKIKDTIMTEENKTETPAPKVDTGAIRNDAVAQERERINTITDLGKRGNVAELAGEFVRNGKSVEDFRTAILDTMIERGQATVADADPNIGLTQKEVKRYSMVKLIRAMSNPNIKAFQQDAAFEFECSEAAAKHLGRSTEGAIVPNNERWNGEPALIMKRQSELETRAKVPNDITGNHMQRDLIAGTAGVGGNLVGTDIQGQSFIDILRNSTVVANLGATILGDLNGNVAIPRKATGAAGFWVTENAAPTETTQTFNQVTGTPKTVGTFTDFSRQLMLQSSVDVENMVRNDLAAGLAVTIDLAALYGSGASGQPTGVSQTSGINAPTAFVGTVPTWAEITTMIGATAAANALMGSLAWVVNPQDMGSLMSTAKDAGSGQFIYDNGMIAGYPAPHTSNVTLGDVFYANWSELIMFMWGGLDILVDPYTGSAAGTTRVTAHQSVDIGLRHPASFTFNNDT